MRYGNDYTGWGKRACGKLPYSTQEVIEISVPERFLGNFGRGATSGQRGGERIGLV